MTWLIIAIFEPEVLQAPRTSGDDAGPNGP